MAITNTLSNKVNVKTISSFSEYVEYTEKYKGQYFFRGQASAIWDIIPSLFRGDKVPTLAFERKNIADKIASNPDQTPFSALFELQHYGTPTRICDLTISPLCALFFSCEGDHDGAVFVVDQKISISADSYEMRILSTILEKNISGFSELQTEYDAIPDIIGIISKNHVVEYKSLRYSNPRALRQGGTGIVFGFGKDSDEILSYGNLNVDDLWIEKIIIPHSIKSDAIQELRKIGYSKEMLLDIWEGHDEVSLTQTEFNVENRARYNKIISKYRVSSLYFYQDQLALEIRRIYEGFLAKYGQDARIWTFFYFDENDCGATPNWICRGVWRNDTQYAIEWTKDYHSYRLNRLNEQISHEKSIKQHFDLAKMIFPYCDQICRCVEKPNYSMSELFELSKGIRPSADRICNLANNIPYSDEKTETVTNKARRLINDISWFVGDMEIFSHRPDLKEQQLRWMIETIYLKRCLQSKEACFMALRELEID